MGEEGLGTRLVIIHVQWNLLIKDTFGTSRLVRSIVERLSSFRGDFLYSGTSKCGHLQDLKKVHVLIREVS